MRNFDLVVSALMLLNRFTEVHLASLKQCDFSAEESQTSAFSFGRKKNNPVFLLKGDTLYLQVRGTIFNLKEKKRIEESDFLEEFFGTKVDQKEEDVLMGNDEGKIVIDFYEQRVYREVAS